MTVGVMPVVDRMCRKTWCVCVCVCYRVVEYEVMVVILSLKLVNGEVFF